MAQSSTSAHDGVEYHPAFEEYCEAIFELEEDDVTVIQARIAERLRVSRPAVSEMVRRMETDGLVVLDDGTISLTRAGRSLASTVVRRHRLAERMLTDILGLPWAEAHHEAGRWEHVMSPAVEAAMTRLLDNPTTCPHGNPIPGSSYVEPDMVSLDSIAVGESFTVARIPEQLEFADGMLEFLESNGLVPGRTGRVLAKSPDGTITVEVGQVVVGVGVFAAERILAQS